MDVLKDLLKAKYMMDLKKDTDEEELPSRYECTTQNFPNNFVLIAI